MDKVSGASGKPDRAAGLRPQPASQSSQSSIPSALASLDNAIDVLGDLSALLDRHFEQQASDLAAALAMGGVRVFVDQALGPWEFTLSVGPKMWERLRVLTAQGTETGTAETEGLGPKDDGPVGEADAPNLRNSDD